MLGRRLAGVLKQRQTHQRHGRHNRQRRNNAQHFAHQSRVPDDHLHARRHRNRTGQLAHPNLPQFQFLVGAHLRHHLGVGTLPLGQTQNGQCGHQKRNGAALDERQAAAPRRLEPRDQTGDKDHGRDDFAAVRIVVFHTQCGRQNERNGDDGADHGEIVLQRQQNAEVPRWGVVDAVDDVGAAAFAIAIGWWFVVQWNILYRRMFFAIVVNLPKTNNIVQISNTYGWHARHILQVDHDGLYIIYICIAYSTHYNSNAESIQSIIACIRN